MPGGFQGLDLAVLIAYLAGITAFGLSLSRRVKSSDGYFRGNRQFRWWIMIGQAFGTGTHAESFVAQTGATFASGFATIWYQWKNMLITPFYWLIAPWYRRSERTTLGEILEDRYGLRFGMTYSAFAIAFFVLNQGVMLQGAAKVVAVATGNRLSPNSIVLAMAGAFLLYSFFGGLISTAYSDFIQGLMIIVLSMMLIPSGLAAVGGMAGMRQVLPPDFFRLYSEVSGLDAFTIAMLAVNGIVGITAQPHMISMCATGNTERAGRIGQTYGSLVKRLCTIGWAFTGLIVAALVVQRGVVLTDGEMAFGYACKTLLVPGLTGLMVACVLAANMAACSNFMVNSGALFTNNFYKKYVRKEPTDRQSLWIGRFSGFGLTLLGVLFALTVRNVLQAFLFTETIAAFMGITVLGGILWKRANRTGAFMAVILSFSLYYLLNVLDAGRLKLVYQWKPEPFGLAMAAGFAAFFLFSWVSRPEASERVERFFDNMSRASDVPPASPGQPKPLAAGLGKDLIMLDAPGWFRAGRWKGFPARYREDLIGFSLAWIMVVALIFLAWGIMQLR
jgi:Na+/proline symporter